MLGFVIKFILLIVVIVGLDSTFIVGQHPILPQFLTAAYTFLSTSVLISICRYLIIFIYTRRKGGEASHRGNFIIGINQLSTILNVSFIVISIFILLGIDIKEFVTSITLIAMAITLIFREYITNIISGLIIMFAEKYNVGDYIKIADHVGKIENIGLQNIRIKNEDGDSVLIPNNAFFISNIVNKSIDNKGSYTVEFQLPVPNDIEVKTVEDLTTDFFKQHPEILIEHQKVSVSKVTFEFIQFKMTINYNEENPMNFSKIKSDYLKFILTHLS